MGRIDEAKIWADKGIAALAATPAGAQAVAKVVSLVYCLQIIPTAVRRI
jgi:hypothetical protein